MDMPREESRATFKLPYLHKNRGARKPEDSDGRGNYPMAILNERGMILECNKPFETLFGFEWGGLTWQHISRLFPNLLGNDFVQAGETTPLRDYLIRCAEQHRAQHRNGGIFSCNLIFVRTAHDGMCCLMMTVIPSGDGRA